MSSNELGHNELGQAASPYLLQHADNPVHWRHGDPAALADAQKPDKPILLSVGYAACHWCHVMAHESFEDDATAAVMNELFVNIKVDREERPDIDHIYMAALHALGEHGGWPLTMFLTPEGEPFWGGTYFPKSARYGQPAFIDVLRRSPRLSRDEPRRSTIMRRVMRAPGRSRAAAGDARRRAARSMPRRSSATSIDPSYGGIARRAEISQPAFSNCSGAPDCAPARHAIRGRRLDPRPHLRKAASTTISAAALPAIRSTTTGWCRISRRCSTTMPSFSNFWRSPSRNGKPLFRQRARETVAWLEREMTTAEGGFSASLDADSEGEEGKFYVWTYAEVMRSSAPKTARSSAPLRRDAAGNFEGHNILNRLEAAAAGTEQTKRGSPLCAQSFWPCGRRACVPASTTRFSPTGTA